MSILHAHLFNFVDPPMHQYSVNIRALKSVVWCIYSNVSFQMLNLYPMFLHFLLDNGLMYMKSYLLVNSDEFLILLIQFENSSEISVKVIFMIRIICRPILFYDNSIITFHEIQKHSITYIRSDWYVIFKMEEISAILTMLWSLL